jgi:hypothetical protein
MELEASLKQVEQNEKYLQNKTKKTKVTSAPLFDWPWFEHFNNIFFGIAIINGIPNVINQAMCVINFGSCEC